MKARYLLPLLLCALLILPVGLISAVGLAREARNPPRAPVGSAFTYQGLLTGDGDPVEGPCDFQFGLWDDPISGTLVAGPVEQTGVALEAGRFTVLLDFGDVFDGTALWLGIAVQCPGDAGYGTLTPRQPLTAAPYARAVSWDGVYAMPAGFADGVDDVDDADADPGNELEMPTGCANGQLAKWDGSGWACAPDDVNDADADPANELEMPTGCANGQLAKWDGSGWVCDDDADTIYQAGYGLTLTNATFHVLTDTVQQRVAGTCAVGSTIRAINADGTVVCQVDAPLNRSNPPADNTITILGSEYAGHGFGTTIGLDGLGLITYEDYTNRDLMVAHCDDLACISSTTTTIDSAGEVGYASSVTIGADGLGLITYYNATNYTLKVAHCENISCTNATISTLDNLGYTPWVHTSIAIGMDGLGLISYPNSSNDLRVAHCDDTACTSASITILDSTNNVGLFPSIAIGVDGLGLISYIDVTNDDVKVAHCDNITCASATLSVLDHVTAGYSTAIVIGTDGLGLIVYRQHFVGDLKAAHCGSITCTSATLTTLDSGGADDVGLFPSVTIGADGLALISYLDITNGDLKMAHCSDMACTSASITVPDSDYEVGGGSAVTIGVDGLPLISYYDNTNKYVKVLHCSNPFCVPYWRRR